MTLESKRVLITGAGGFIGSHLAEHLVEAGAKVRALVRYNSSGSWGWLEAATPECRDAIEIVTGDIRDPHMARELVRDCEVVFHLAALIGIPYSYVAPAEYLDTNISGTTNLLMAARDSNIERFVQTSTSEVYGTARSVPITESHPLHPQSPYAASKVAADQMALAFQRSFGLPVVVVRPFNAYGPRQSARAVLPTIITQVLKGDGKVRLGAVTPTRDFNYVTDLAAGFAAAAVSTAAIGEVVNLGSNFEISIGDAADLIAEITQRRIDIVADDERVRPPASEVERLWASNEKAGRLLNWSPLHGGRDGFRRGLTKTIEWFSEPGNLERYKPEIYSL